MNEMIEKAGGTMSTPTILIGDTVIIGFDPNRMTSELGL